MSILLNGTSSFAYATLGSGQPITGSPLTFSCTFKTPAVLPSAISNILMFTNNNYANSNVRGYGFQISATNDLTFIGVVTSSTTTSASIARLLPNTVYKIALVKDAVGNGARMYVDGPSCNVQKDVTVTANTIAYMLAGKYPAASGFAAGEISDISFWKAALTSDDIAAILAPQGTPLMASIAPNDYWPCLDTGVAFTANTGNITTIDSSFSATPLITRATTVALGDGNIANFPEINTQYQGTTWEYLRQFIATENRSVNTLYMTLTDRMTSTDAYMTLRDSAGNLLGINNLAVASGTSIGLRWAKIPSVDIVSGQTYYVGWISSNYLKLQSKPSDASFFKRSTESTYAVPGSAIDLANATAVIGSRPMVWAEGMASIDVTPNVISFPSRLGAVASTQYESAPGFVSGIDGDQTVNISVVNGQYVVDVGTGFGAYTSSASTVKLGNKVKVRNTASSSANAAVTTTLTVGGVASTFVIDTTPVSDTTPDAISFTAVTGATLGSTVTSNTVTVTGFDAAVNVSVTNGTYSVNGGSYTSTAGTLSVNDTVAVRVIASSSLNTSVVANLTVGTVTAPFSVTSTTTGDTVPNAFTFAAVTGANLSTTITSGSATITGIDTPSPISITGGTYSVNGGSYVSTSGTVSVNDSITIRVMSSASSSTPTSATVTIGGVSASFTVTTKVVTIKQPTQDKSVTWTLQAGVWKKP